MKGRPLLFLLFASLSVLPATAMLDDNANGMSDVWEAAFGEGHVPGADDDGDGFDNRDESIAGTDRWTRRVVRCCRRSRR